MKTIILSMILSKPRLMRRAHLNGVSKGGEHPFWSRAGFKPRSRINLIIRILRDLGVVVVKKGLYPRPKMEGI